MRTIGHVDRHLVVWSMLDDHSLERGRSMLSDDLIDRPDLSDPLENRLRFDVLNSTREFFTQKLRPESSFTIAQVSCTEIANAMSPFKNIKMSDLTMQYGLALATRTGFTFKDVTKTADDVRSMEQRRKYLSRFKISSEHVIRDVRQRGPSAAMNKTVFASVDGELRVVDGTHRLVAYLMNIEKQLKTIPQTINAFVVRY